MATSKGTHPRKKRTSRFLRFPQVNGKTIESIEVDPDLESISIWFKDKTVLSFDFDLRLAVFPELSDWKTESWRRIKRWRPLHSRPSMVSWL